MWVLHGSYLQTAQGALLLNLLTVIACYVRFLYSTAISSFLAINKYHMLRGLMDFAVLASRVISSHNCKMAMFEVLHCLNLWGFLL